jgi:F420-dependent oxidoreductase-like protein
MSGPQVVEGWHGQPFDHQLQRTREYIGVVRKALARETVTYDGDFYSLPRPGGPGKPLKLIIKPLQERIPVYLAAIGPKNTALAAELAEGWLPTFFAPYHIDFFRPSLEEGARRAGRPVDEIDIAPMTSIAINDDIDAARNLMRPFLALYVGGMGSRKKNFYKDLVTRYGYGEIAEKVQDLYLDQKYDEAMAALPAELIDKTALCGPKEAIAERLDVYRDAGVGTLLVTPVASTVERKIEMLRELADLAS